jgi:ASC-1-like (ASCH) protein
MYLVYNDFNEMVKSEGIHNVLTDLENVYPELYSNLIQEVIKRHNIKKNGTLLTKC